ncbi:MAG: helix-turn-helix domain-containing protein [Burkholderiales bacterium]
MRQLRLRQNFTQAELAGRAGISFGAVRSLETSGQSTLATFIKCVDALGASQDIDKLLSAEPNSIADLEKEMATRQRRRARSPRARSPKSIPRA